jgi:hypothetical protein
MGVQSIHCTTNGRRNRQVSAAKVLPASWGAAGILGYDVISCKLSRGVIFSVPPSSPLSWA